MSDLSYITNLSANVPALISSTPKVKAVHFDNYPVQQAIIEIIVVNKFSDDSETYNEIRPPFRIAYTSGDDGTSKIEYPLIDFDTESGQPELVGKATNEDLFNTLKSWSMHFMSLHLKALADFANTAKLQKEAEAGNKAMQMLHQIQTGNIPAELYNVKV